MEEAENPDDAPIPKIDESSTSPAMSCALCGSSTPAVRCDRCSSQIFCLSCDDMYHRHPKRKLHLRKAVDSIWNSSKSPRLRRRTELPGDPSKIPIPPPRSKKRERHTIGGGRLFLKQNHELGSFGHSKMFDLRTIAPPSKDVFAGQKTSPNIEGTYENETNMSTTVAENIATGNDIYENENIPVNTGGNVDNSNSMGQAPWNMPRTNISSPIQVSIPSSSPDMITNGQSFGYPMKPQSRSIADLTGAPPHPIGAHPYHLPHYPYMHPPMHPSYSHSMAHLNCAQCMSSSWSNLMSPHPSPYFHPMPWGSANASLARGHPMPGANGHMKHGSVPSFPDPNFHFPYPGGAFYANGTPVVDPNFINLHQQAVEPQKVKRSPSGSRQTLSPENPENMEVTTDSAPEVKTDENPAPRDVNRRKQEVDDELPKIPEPPSRPWSCLHCTYVNPPGIHVCEVCCKTSYGNASQPENQNEGRSFDSRNSDSPMELVNLDALSQSPDFIKQRPQKDEGSIGADSLETEEVLDTKDQELAAQTPEPSVMLTTETQTSTTTKSTDVQTQNLVFQSIASSTDSIFPKQEISVQTDTQTTAKNCSVATDPMISSQSMESLMSGFSAPPYQNRRAGWGRGASFSTQSLYERGRSRSPIPRSLSEAQSFVRDSSLPPEEAMHSWSQAWLMSDPMYYKPHNLPGYGQTGKEDYYDGTWGSMDKLNRRVKSKQGKKSEANPRPKFHRSLDDLKAEKTQDVIHSRELQFLQTVKEAERCGFSLEDLHVAYLHCGKENPVFWLEDNWSFMIKNVIALAAKYGEDNEENDVGVITASEAKIALHIHRGDIWDAVTECIENRQRKILELTVRGNFTQKQIADALKNNEGNVELAYADLLRVSSRRHKFILSPGLSEDSEYNPVDETAVDHNVSIKAGKLDVSTDSKADKKKSDFLTKLSAIRQAQSERRKAREEKEMIRETTTQEVPDTLEARIESPQSENVHLPRTEESSCQEPIADEPVGDIEKELADAKLEFDVPIKDSAKKDNEDNLPEDYDTNWVESQGEWIEEYSDEQWEGEEEGDGQWVSLQKKYQSMEKEFEEEARQMAALWEKEELEDDVFEEEPKEALPESSEAERMKQEQDAKFQQWVKVNIEKSLSEPEENESNDQPFKLNLSKEPSLSRSVEFDEGLICKSPLQHYPTEIDLSLKADPDWVELEDAEDLDVAQKSKREAELEVNEQDVLEIEDQKQNIDNSDEEWEKIDLEIDMLDEKEVENMTSVPILDSRLESLPQAPVGKKNSQTQYFEKSDLGRVEDIARDEISSVPKSVEVSELNENKSPEVAFPKPPVRRRSKLNTAAIEEVLKSYEPSAEASQLSSDVPPALPLKRKDKSPENTLKDIYAVPDKHKAKAEDKSETEIVSLGKRKEPAPDPQAPLKPPRVNLSPSIDFEAETGEKRSLNVGFSKDASPVTSLSNESDSNCFADSESDPEIKIIRQKYMHRKAAKYENEEDDMFDETELTSKLEEPESPSALRKEVELQSKAFEFDPELPIPVGTRGSRVVEIDEVESPKAFREGTARPLQLFKVTKQSSTEMTPEPPPLAEQNRDIDTMVSGIVKAYQEHVSEIPDLSKPTSESLALESKMRDYQMEFSIPEPQLIHQDVVDPHYYNTSQFEQPPNLKNIEGMANVPQVAPEVPLQIPDTSIPIVPIPEEPLPMSYEDQRRNEEEEEIAFTEVEGVSAAADYFFGRYNEVTVAKPKKRTTVVKGGKTPTPAASKAMSTSEITVPPVSQPALMEKSASAVMMPSSTPNAPEPTAQPQKAPRSPKTEGKSVSTAEPPQEPEYLSFAEDYFFGSYNEVVVPKKGKKKIPPKPIPKVPEKAKVDEVIPTVTSVPQAEMVSPETSQIISSSSATSPAVSALQHAESTTSLYFDTSSLMEDTFYLAETEDQSADNVMLNNNDKRVKSVHFEDPQPVVVPPPRKNRPKVMESNRSSISSYTSAADEFMYEQYGQSSQLSAVDKKKLHLYSEDFKLNQESDPSNFPCESFLQPSDQPESVISSEISVCTSKESSNIIKSPITGLFDKNTEHELSDEFLSHELLGSDNAQDFIDRQSALSHDATIASDAVSGDINFDEEIQKISENLQTFEFSKEDNFITDKISEGDITSVETVSAEQNIAAECSTIQSPSKITPSFDTSDISKEAVITDSKISEAGLSASENASIVLCSDHLLKYNLQISEDGNSNFKMASGSTSEYATDVTDKEISEGHSPVSEDILISDSYTVKLESSSMTNRIQDEEANVEIERDTYSVHIDEDFEDGLLLVEEAENLINEFCDIYPSGIFDIASSNEIQNLNTKNNKQESSTYDSEHEWKLNEERYNTLNANFIENKLYKSKGSSDPHISDVKESLIIDIKSSAEGSEVSDISLEASTSDFAGISDIGDPVFASSEDHMTVTNQSDILSAEASISESESGTGSCIVTQTTSESILTVIQPLSILCQEAVSSVDFEPSCSKSMTLECTQGAEDEEGLLSELDYSKSEFLDVSIDVSDESLVTSTRSSISTQIPVPSDVQIQDLMDELDYEVESKTPVQTAAEEGDETLDVPSNTDCPDQTHQEIASDEFGVILSDSSITDPDNHFSSKVEHDTYIFPDQDGENFPLTSDKDTDLTRGLDTDDNIVDNILTTKDHINESLYKSTSLDTNISLTIDNTIASLPELKESNRDFPMTIEEDSCVEYGIISDVYSSASQNQVSVNEEEQVEIQHTIIEAEQCHKTEASGSSEILPYSSKLVENEIEDINVDSCKDESPVSKTDHVLMEEDSEESCVSLMSHFYDEWFENVKTSEKSSILQQDVRSKYAAYYNYAESSNSGSASENEDFTQVDATAVSNILSTEVEFSIEEGKASIIENSGKGILEQDKDQDVDTCDSSIEIKTFDELPHQIILMDKLEDQYKDIIYEKDIKNSGEFSEVTSEELTIFESNRQIIESVGYEDKIFTTTKSCQTDDSFEEDQFFDSFDDPLMDPSFLYLPIDKKENIEPVKVEIGIQCHLITSEFVVSSDKTKTLVASKSEMKTYKSEEIQVGKGDVNIFEDPMQINDAENEKVMVTDVTTLAKDDSSFEISEDSDSDLFLEPHSSHDELDAERKISISNSSFLCAEIDSGFSSGSDCGKKTYKQVANAEDLIIASSAADEISITHGYKSEHEVEMTDDAIKQEKKSTSEVTEVIKDETAQELPEEESIKVTKMALFQSNEQHSENIKEISCISTSQNITSKEDGRSKNIVDSGKTIGSEVADSDIGNDLFEEDIFERAVTPIAIEKIPSIEDLTFIELQTDITEQIVHSETIVHSESCSTPTVEYFYGSLPISVMSKISPEGSDYFVEALDLLDACASEITKNHVENALASLACDHASSKSDSNIDSEELSESLSSFHELDDDSLTESASEYFLPSDDDEKASSKQQLEEKNTLQITDVSSLCETLHMPSNQGTDQKSDLKIISLEKSKEVKSNIQSSSITLSNVAKKSPEDVIDKKTDEATESFSVEPDSLNDNDKTCDASEFEDSLYLESTSEYSLPADTLPKVSEKLTKPLPITRDGTNFSPQVEVVEATNEVENLIQDNIESKVSASLNKVQIEENILQPHFSELEESFYSESIPDYIPPEKSHYVTVSEKINSVVSSAQIICDDEAFVTQTTCVTPADSSEKLQSSVQSESSEINIQKLPETIPDSSKTLKTPSSHIESCLSTSTVGESLYLDSIPDYFSHEAVSVKPEKVESSPDTHNISENTCKEDLFEVSSPCTVTDGLTVDKKHDSVFTRETEIASTSTSKTTEEELKITSYKSDIPPVPSDIVRYLYYGDDITFEEDSSVHDDTSFNSAHNVEPISESEVIHSDNSFQSLDSDLKDPKQKVKAIIKEQLPENYLASNDTCPELIHQDLPISVDEQSAEYQSIQTYSSDPECFESAYSEHESTEQWYELEATRSLPIHEAVFESIPKSESCTETNSLTKEDSELPCIPELILEQGTKDIFPVAKVDSDEVTDISTHFTMTEDDSDKFSDIESDSSLQDFEADGVFPLDIQSKYEDAINENIKKEADHVCSGDHQELSKCRNIELSRHENDSHSEVFLDPNANEQFELSAQVCALKENLESEELVEDTTPSPIRDFNGNVTESPINLPTSQTAEVLPLTLEKVSSELDQQICTTLSKEIESISSLDSIIPSSSSFIQTPENEFCDISQTTESCYTSPIMESEYWLDANNESVLETEDSEFILPTEGTVDVLTTQNNIPIASDVIPSEKESESREIISSVKIQTDVIKQYSENIENFSSISNIENATQHVICSMSQEVASDTEVIVLPDLSSNEVTEEEDTKQVLNIQESKEPFVSDLFSIKDNLVEEIDPAPTEDKGAIIEMEVKSTNEMLMSEALEQAVILKEESRKLYETKETKFEDLPRYADVLPSVVSNVIETECMLNFGNKEGRGVSLEGKVCHEVPEDSAVQIEPDFSLERECISQDFISSDAVDNSSELPDAKRIDLSHQEETFSFSKFGYLFKDGKLVDSHDSSCETNPDSPLNVDLSVKHTEEFTVSSSTIISVVDKSETFLAPDSELLEESEQSIITMGQISTVSKTDDKQHIKDKECSYLSIEPDDFDNLKKDFVSGIQPQEILISNLDPLETKTSQVQEVVENLGETKAETDSSSVLKTVPDEVTQVQYLVSDETSLKLDQDIKEDTGLKESVNKDEMTDASFRTLSDESDSWHEEDSEALVEDFPIDNVDNNLSLNQVVIDANREIVPNKVEDAKFVYSDKSQKTRNSIASNDELVSATTVKSLDSNIQKETPSKIESFSYSETESANFYSACDDLDNTSVITSDEDFTDVPSHFTLTEDSEAWSDVETDVSNAFDDCEEHYFSMGRDKTPTREDGGYTFRDEDFYSFKGNIVDEATKDDQMEKSPLESEVSSKMLLSKCSVSEDKVEIAKSVIEVQESECPLPQFISSYDDSLPKGDTINVALIVGDDNTVLLRGCKDETNDFNIETSNDYAKDGACSDVLEENIKLGNFEKDAHELVSSSQGTIDKNVNDFNVAPVIALKKDNSEDISDLGNEGSEQSSYSIFKSISKDEESENFSDIESEIYGDFEDSLSKADEQQHSETFDFVPFAEESGKSTVKRNKNSKKIVGKVVSTDKKKDVELGSSFNEMKKDSSNVESSEFTAEKPKEQISLTDGKRTLSLSIADIVEASELQQKTDETTETLLLEQFADIKSLNEPLALAETFSIFEPDTAILRIHEDIGDVSLHLEMTEDSDYWLEAETEYSISEFEDEAVSLSIRDITDPFFMDINNVSDHHLYATSSQYSDATAAGISTTFYTDTDYSEQISDTCADISLQGGTTDTSDKWSDIEGDVAIDEALYGLAYTSETNKDLTTAPSFSLQEVQGSSKVSEAKITPDQPFNLSLAGSTQKQELLKTSGISEKVSSENASIQLSRTSEKSSDSVSESYTQPLSDPLACNISASGVSDEDFTSITPLDGTVDELDKYSDMSNDSSLEEIQHDSKSISKKSSTPPKVTSDISGKELSLQVSKGTVDVTLSDSMNISNVDKEHGLVSEIKYNLVSEISKDFCSETIKTLKDDVQGSGSIVSSLKDVVTENVVYEELTLDTIQEDVSEADTSGVASKEDRREIAEIESDVVDETGTYDRLNLSTSPAYENGDYENYEDNFEGDEYLEGGEYDPNMEENEMEFGEEDYLDESVPYIENEDELVYPLQTEDWIGESFDLKEYGIDYGMSGSETDVHGFGVNDEYEDMQRAIDFNISNFDEAIDNLIDDQNLTTESFKTISNGTPTQSKMTDKEHESWSTADADSIDDDLSEHDNVISKIDELLAEDFAYDHTDYYRDDEGADVVGHEEMQCISPVEESFKIEDKEVADIIVTKSGAQAHSAEKNLGTLTEVIKSDEDQKISGISSKPSSDRIIDNFSISKQSSEVCAFSKETAIEQLETVALKERNHVEQETELKSFKVKKSSQVVSDIVSIVDSNSKISFEHSESLTVKEPKQIEPKTISTDESKDKMSPDQLKTFTVKKPSKDVLETTLSSDITKISEQSESFTVKKQHETETASVASSTSRISSEQSGSFTFEKPSKDVLETTSASDLTKMSEQSESLTVKEPKQIEPKTISTDESKDKMSPDQLKTFTVKKPSKDVLETTLSSDITKISEQSESFTVKKQHETEIASVASSTSRISSEQSGSFTFKKPSKDVLETTSASDLTKISEESESLTVKEPKQIEPKTISTDESKDKMSPDQLKTFTVKKPSKDVLETTLSSDLTKISEQPESFTVKKQHETETVSVVSSTSKISSEQSGSFTFKKPSKEVLETTSACDLTKISEQSESFTVKKQHETETASVVSSTSKISSEQSGSFTFKKPSKEVLETTSACDLTKISEQSESFTVKKQHETATENASVVSSTSKISSEQSESFTLKKPSQVLSEAIPVVDSNCKVLTDKQGSLTVEKTSHTVSENVLISDSHPKSRHDEKKEILRSDFSSEISRVEFEDSESTKSERLSNANTAINQSLNISSKEGVSHSETKTAVTLSKTFTTDSTPKMEQALIEEETTKLDLKNKTKITDPPVNASARSIDKPIIKEKVSETESNIPFESKQQTEKQLPPITSETASSTEQTDTTVRRRRVRRTSQSAEEESGDSKPDIPLKRRRDSALREARKAPVSSPDDQPSDSMSSSSDTSDDNKSKPDIPEKRKRKPALPKAEPKAEKQVPEAPSLPPKTIKRDSSSDSISSSVFLSSSSESLSCYESTSLKDASKSEAVAEPEAPDVPARKAPVRQRRRESSEDTSSSINRSESSRRSYDLPPKESMDLCRKRTSIDERMVKLQAAGKCTTKESAFIAAKLIEMQFEEEDALLASRQCSSIYHAVKFLTQLCELCQCRFPINSMASMIHCAHRACKECLKAHFTNQIYDRSIFTLLCPICQKPDITDQNIQEYFNHLEMMFRNILDTHVYDLFQRKLRDEVLTKDPNFHWCSQCSSGFIASPRLRKLYCPDCSAITCASCHQTWESEHEGVHCERFQQWKDMHTPEPPPAGLVKFLTDRGITCPSCDINYAQACAGCMMYKCSHCSFEFCGFCSQPCKRGKECGNKQCELRGVHAHHPYSCLSFLRDKDVSELQMLLDEESVKYLTIPPKDQIVKSRCQVREQKHTHGSITEDRCGRDIVPYCAGLCRIHYYEYLVELMRKNKINPLSLMTTQDLQFMLRKSRCPVPEKVKGESIDEFYDRLTETVSSTLS